MAQIFVLVKSSGEVKQRDSPCSGAVQFYSPIDHTGTDKLDYRDINLLFAVRYFIMLPSIS